MRTGQPHATTAGTARLTSGVITSGAILRHTARTASMAAHMAARLTAGGAASMLRARWTPRRRPSRLTQSSSDGCFLSPSLSPAALMGSRVLPAAQPPPDSCESPTPQGQAQRRARGSPEQK